MNTGAIIMMIIGCGGLWGGFLVAVSIALKHSKAKKV
ncbi:MetS family NSS transporter small subunit [Clostridium sp.]